MTRHNAALVEQTNAAIEQTENQANDLDRIVDQFVVAGGSSRTTMSRPEPHKTAAPAPEALAKGIKALQEKVTSAPKVVVGGVEKFISRLPRRARRRGSQEQVELLRRKSALLIGRPFVVAVSPVCLSRYCRKLPEDCFVMGQALISR